MAGQTPRSPRSFTRHPSQIRRALLLAAVLMAVAVAPVAADPADPADAAAGPGQNRLPAALAAVIADAERDGGQVSFACMDLAGNWLATHRATQAMIPASNQKLATTAAAAAVLGADHQFETQLVALGRMEVVGESGNAARINGDLLIRGGGDPTISRRFDDNDDPRGPFRRWARHLTQALGLREISGDLICDASCFDDQFIHPDWPRDQLLKWYEAPVAGLSLEDNCFRLIVTPREGANARLSTDPPCDALELSGAVDTSGGRGNPQVWFSATDSSGTDARARRLRVGGRIPAGSAPYSTDVTVRDPVRYFGTVLLETLQAEGIAIGGSLKIADTPVDAERVAAGLVLHSERTPLPRAMTVCNQRSQNCYAEHIFKRLGQVVSGQRGSFATGSAAVGAWLQQQGVPEDECRVADGSGMARSNRLSSRAVVTLLRSMTLGLQPTGHPVPGEPDAEARAAAMFRDSLAVAGSSGTLARRLTHLKDRVAGKTGTLNGVDSLSGYLIANDAAGQPRPVCFSILANGISGGHGRARQLLDRLVTRLADWLPTR